MSDAVDKQEIAPELALLCEEIDGTPDRGVIDDPEMLRQYLRLLQNLHNKGDDDNKELLA